MALSVQHGSKCEKHFRFGLAANLVFEVTTEVFRAMQLVNRTASYVQGLKANAAALSQKMHQPHHQFQFFPNFASLRSIRLQSSHMAFFALYIALLIAIAKAPEELENPPFGRYMGKPPTKVPVCKRPHQISNSFRPSGRASEGRVNISPAMENQ